MPVPSLSMYGAAFWQGVRILPGETLFGTYHVAGLPALRKAVAVYLRTARGVRCTADQIVITTGAQAAFDLLARLLLDPGDCVWMEEPGYFGAQSAFVAAGAKLAPLRVGLDGWQMDQPPHSARLFFVTPACQHPLGVTMRMEQRLRLLEIAEHSNAWVIEDDFDGEYRFQGQPIPAMQGSDQSGRVIYVGTFAKILFPALRLGFMVLPPELHERIPHALSTTGQFAPLLLPAALADFITEGHMTRHLKRMRRIYAARRQRIHELTEIKISGGGYTHFFGRRVSRSSPCSGRVWMTGVSPRKRDGSGSMFCHCPSITRHGHPEQGLVLGYAACDKSQTEHGLRKLREAIDRSAE